MDTALGFALRDVLDLAISRLNALNDALGHLSDHHAKSKVMAYTRMQPALPTTGAELVAKWRQPISDILGCLAQAHDGLSVIQWGGPIGVRDHRDADRLGAGERCASTSNRNFEGRQGAGGRTHLVSPAMAAAAAITGHFVDVRQWNYEQDSAEATVGAVSQ